jgi:hypothetical protein
MSERAPTLANLPCHRGGFRSRPPAIPALPTACTLSLITCHLCQIPSPQSLIPSSSSHPRPIWTDLRRWRDSGQLGFILSKAHWWGRRRIDQAPMVPHWHGAHIFPMEALLVCHEPISPNPPACQPTGPGGFCLQLADWQPTDGHAAATSVGGSPNHRPDRYPSRRLDN